MFLIGIFNCCSGSCLGDRVLVVHKTFYMQLHSSQKEKKERNTPHNFLYKMSLWSSREYYIKIQQLICIFLKAQLSLSLNCFRFPQSDCSHSLFLFSLHKTKASTTRQCSWTESCYNGLVVCLRYLSSCAYYLKCFIMFHLFIAKHILLHTLLHMQTKLWNVSIRLFTVNMYFS